MKNRTDIIKSIQKESKHQKSTCMYSANELNTFSELRLKTILEAIKALRIGELYPIENFVECPTCGDVIYCGGGDY